mmetsp:Transcript_29230/g.84972  ORF Transcript_29230/g.84972 Transcript_29230/m.84972 type:complete len:260 (-) Transcript_29230:2804-3583(-)
MARTLRSTTSSTKPSSNAAAAAGLVPAVAPAQPPATMATPAAGVASGARPAPAASTRGENRSAERGRCCSNLAGCRAVAVAGCWVVTTTATMGSLSLSISSPRLARRWTTSPGRGRRCEAVSRSSSRSSRRWMRCTRRTSSICASSRKGPAPRTPPPSGPANQHHRRRPTGMQTNVVVHLGPRMENRHLPVVAHRKKRSRKLPMHGSRRDAFPSRRIWTRRRPLSPNRQSQPNPLRRQRRPRRRQICRPIKSRPSTRPR